jgi:Protein of unknown function (DUF3450)
MTRASFLSVCLLIFALPVAAQTDRNTVPETVDGTLSIEQDTQSRRDAWAARRDSLEVRFQAATANVAHLQSQRDLQQEKVTALDLRVAEFRRRLQESDRLQDNIQDTMDQVMLALSDWVENDLPFLREERRLRIEALQGELARPDVSHAEKLRRLLESLQIEAAYGGSVEVTQEEIDVAGERVFADILRIGRVSLFWRTPDGRRVGEYDRGSAAWRELADKQARPIGLAMDMATRVRPVELISLPLGRMSR